MRDTQQWRTPSRTPAEFAAMGWGARRYLNSGVLLFDGPRWRAQNLAARCVEIARDPAFARAYSRNDQSALNLALRGAWSELSPVWNWQWTAASRFLADEAGARLIHFIGPKKPWKTMALPPRLTRGYAPFLAAQFGLDAALPAARRGLTPLSRPLLKHWLRLRAMQAYLDRFPAASVTLAPR